MNLDTLSYSDAIQQAVKWVGLSEKGGSWVLLGYENRLKKSSLMTVNVKGEGIIWIDLLDSFEDNQVQYAYVKLDLEAKGNMKFFLIHWIGKDVEENYKLSCMSHLAEIRNLLNPYDLIVDAMDAIDVQAKVHGFLCRNETACLRINSSLEVSSQSSGNTSPKEQSLRANIQERSERTPYTTHGEEVPFVRPRGNSTVYIPPLNPAEELPKIKVVIIGDVAVGKTYIYRNYDTGGTGSTRSELSFIDFMTKNVRLGRHNFILQMWDTAGEERFGAFMPSWLRNAKVVIFVYDVTDKLSYQAIPKHVEIAKRYADPRAILFLVGNKVDLEHRREVQEADGERLAVQYDMMFMECSGLTGYNITNLFESITKRVVSGFEDKFTSSGISLLEDPTIRLNSNNRGDRPRDKKCSCLRFRK